MEWRGGEIASMKEEWSQAPFVCIEIWDTQFFVVVTGPDACLF